MTAHAMTVRWTRWATLLAALLLSLSVQAATLPASARSEIVAMLERLGASGCQFNRNGTWYAPAKARDHLLRKLEYLEDKGLVDSAEQFIERGASRSSMTGQAYTVKCGNDEPVESSVWLTAQLAAVRGRAAASRSQP